jgi:hypothetical protein
MLAAPAGGRAGPSLSRTEGWFVLAPFVGSERLDHRLADVQLEADPERTPTALRRPSPTVRSAHGALAKLKERRGAGQITKQSVMSVNLRAAY